MYEVEAVDKRVVNSWGEGDGESSRIVEEDQRAGVPGEF